MKTRIFNPFRSGISAVLSILTLGCIAAPSAFAKTLTWDGEGPNGQWNQGTAPFWINWVGDAVFATGDDIVFASTNAGGAATLLTAPGGNREIKSLTFQSGSPAYDIRLTPGPLGTTAANLTFSLSNTGITVDSGDTSSHTIGKGSLGGNVAMLANLTVTHNGSGTLAFDQPITGTGFGLTKDGTGTMKLNALNTYDGATQVNGGILVFGKTAAKATGTVTAGASGIVGLGLGGTGYYTAADVATLFNNALTGYSLDTTSGVAVDTTATALFDQGSGNILTGSRSFTKLGTGSYRMNAANTYTGATNIKEGTLSLGAALNGGLLNPSSIITISSGATFQISKNDTIAMTQGTHFGNITGAGGFSHFGAAAGSISILNQANSYSGPTAIKVGTLSLGDGGANGTLNPSSTITIDSGATFRINKNNTTTQGTDFGTIAGAGNLTHVGTTNITILNQVNSYSGVTTVAGGTGRLEFSVAADGGNPSSLGSSSNAAENLLLANTSTLRYTGAAGSTDRSFTINGTTNGNNATLDASGIGPINFTNPASPAYGITAQTRTLILAGANTDDNTLAAGVADNGLGLVTITKNGPGKWILSGTSTNTAGVIMNEGTLLINGSLSGGANLNVNGGTLGGTGTIVRQVAVYPGGSVSPGGSAGNTLTLGGNLTFGVFTGITTGKLVYELGAIASSDKIDLTTGTLVLGTALIDLDDFTLTDVGLENGTYTLISTTKVINGTLGTNLTGTLGGKNILLQKSLDNKNLELVVSSTGSPYGTWATSKGLTGLAGSSTDPAKDADPDKDGRNNLAEFAFNGDPLSGSDNGKVFVLTEDSDVDGDTTKELLLTIAVRTGTPVFAGTPSPSANYVADGITYNVEGSLSLASFATTVNVVPTPVTTGLPAAGTGYEYRSFSLDGSNGLTGKGFLRAKVTSP